jgi:hypothetical protein
MKIEDCYFVASEVELRLEGEVEGPEEVQEEVGEEQADGIQCLSPSSGGKESYTRVSLFQH